MTITCHGSRRIAAKLLRTRWLVRAPIWLYRARLGFVFGDRLLMLEHIGRISGQSRYVVLEVVDHPDDAFIVAAGFGEGAQWLRNLEADPNAHISVGTRVRVPGSCQTDEFYGSARRALTNAATEGSTTCPFHMSCSARRCISCLTLAAVAASCARYVWPMVATPPAMPAQRALHRTCQSHLSNGMGKRSAAAEAAEAVRNDLLPHADVVLIGYRPGALSRFGFAARTLSARNVAGSGA